MSLYQENSTRKPRKPRRPKPFRLPEGTDNLTIPELLRKLPQRGITVPALSDLTGVPRVSLYKRVRAGQYQGLFFRSGLSIRFDSRAVAQHLEEGGSL